MAETVFAGDVNIGDENPLGHVDPYTTRIEVGLLA